MAQADAGPSGDQELAGFNPRRIRQYSFMEMEHEIFSIVILKKKIFQRE